MPNIEIPENFQLWETRSAYERRGREGRGPFELDRCFVCDKPVRDGGECLGMRIENPSGKIQIVAGIEDYRTDGAHFNIHVGLQCLVKALKAFNRGIVFNRSE